MRVCKVVCTFASNFFVVVVVVVASVMSGTGPLGYTENCIEDVSGQVLFAYSCHTYVKTLLSLCVDL